MSIDIKVERFTDRNVESIFDYYKKYETHALRDPFRRMNRHRIKKALAANNMIKSKGNPSIYFVREKRNDYGIKCVSGKVIRKIPNCYYIHNLCTSDTFHVKKLFDTNYKNVNTVVEVSLDWPAIRNALTKAGFVHVSSKITAFADCLGIFVRLKDDSKKMNLRALGNKHDELSDNGVIFPVNLDIKLDIDKIAQKLKRLPSEVFANHYSNYNEGNSWSAICLYGYGGITNFVTKPSVRTKKWKKENPETLDYELEKTPLMEFFPEIDAILDQIPGEKDRVRFMKLTKDQGTLGRHTDKADKDAGVEIGDLVRLHIPIITNEKVLFKMWNKCNNPTTVHMNKGQLWYLDIRKPHMATNGGKEDRIHLVIDTYVTTELFRVLYNSFKENGNEKG